MLPEHGTVARAFRVLSLFSPDQPRWHLNEIARSLGIKRSTLGRLLSALEQDDLICRLGADHVYVLGPGWVKLGTLAESNNTLVRLGEPLLVTLAAQSSETASLDVLEGSTTRMIAEVKGRWVRNEPSSIGGHWAAHASSTGKTLLSGLSADALAALLTEPLLPLTPHTCIEPANLTQDIVDLRETGWLIAHEELEMGYSDLSAPVHSAEGKVIAALSLGGATERFQVDRLDALLDLLLPLATRLSHLLGFRNPG
jgi:DNA-binding IclR family transcriptional regulator